MDKKKQCNGFTKNCQCKFVNNLNEKGYCKKHYVMGYKEFFLEERHMENVKINNFLDILENIEEVVKIRVFKQKGNFRFSEDNDVVYHCIIYSLPFNRLLFDLLEETTGEGTKCGLNYFFSKREINYFTRLFEDDVKCRKINFN